MTQISADGSIEGLDKPEDLPKAFADAWANRDAATLANLFVEDADFVNVVGLWWHNRADIQKAHDYGLRTFFRHSTISIGRVKTRHIRHDIATVHVRWSLQGQLDQQGNSLDKRQTVMMFIVEKRVNGWVCLAAQNTDVVSGMETYQAKDGGLEAADYR